MGMENLSIAQHRDTLRYAHTRGGSYKPKVKQFDVSDFVYFQQQPNDTLDTFSGHTILKIKAIKPSGALELQRIDGHTYIQINPKILPPTTCQTQILPSSHQLGFLHLTIHVMYVKRQTMLIRCCFVIIVMVDTIYFTSSQSSFNFSLAFGIVHHVFLHHFNFYLDHATLFPAQVWGWIHENFISASSCALYIYLCMHLFLLDQFLPLNGFSLFYLIKFIMDLHPYDTIRHNTIRHNNYHARMHAFIHDNQLWGCKSCLLGLMYILKVNVRFQDVVRYQMFQGCGLFKVLTCWRLYKRRSSSFLLLVF